MCRKIFHHQMHHDVRTFMILDPSIERQAVFVNPRHTSFHRCELSPPTAGAWPPNKPHQPSFKAPAKSSPPNESRATSATMDAEQQEEEEQQNTLGCQYHTCCICTEEIEFCDKLLGKQCPRKPGFRVPDSDSDSDEEEEEQEQEQEQKQETRKQKPKEPEKKKQKSEEPAKKKQKQETQQQKAAEKEASHEPEECALFTLQHRHTQLPYFGLPGTHDPFPSTWNTSAKELDSDWAGWFQRDEAEQPAWEEKFFLACEKLYTLEQDAKTQFLVYRDLLRVLLATMITRDTKNAGGSGSSSSSISDYYATRFTAINGSNNNNNNNLNINGTNSGHNTKHNTNGDDNGDNGDNDADIRYKNALGQAQLEVAESGVERAQVRLTEQKEKVTALMWWARGVERDDLPSFVPIWWIRMWALKDEAFTDY
ncbi:uncharacterized protein GGS25DRAFT_531134 [Hypoxylon fragiforme]|uniref:uncharacterized protein n=1 Tax=Hypoxylon fragiforme TaxID=63214 RepID=UPI0020C6E54F|nr:uncharacterized protein GGS25DRAFT_531134 [Hypoxylon fragiforme]KAI2610230.1 hypothetical protein GGS25DRAFT_531134 [Hypoxylon fragiforme]